MQKYIAILLLFCLIQGIYSACKDGQFATSGGYDLALYGTCSICSSYCKTCTNIGSCITYIDKIKGIDGSGTLLCPGGRYNPDSKTCHQFCTIGCLSCMVDYNICT